MKAGAVWSRLMEASVFTAEEASHTLLVWFIIVSLVFTPFPPPFLLIWNIFPGISQKLFPQWTLIWYKHVKSGIWSDRHLWAYTHTSLHLSEYSCALHIAHEAERLICVPHITLSNSDVIMVVTCSVYYFDLIISSIHFTSYVYTCIFSWFFCLTKLM